MFALWKVRRSVDTRETLHSLFWIYLQPDLDLLPLAATGIWFFFSCCTLTSCRCDYSGCNASFSSKHAMKFYKTRCHECPPNLAETESYRSMSSPTHAQTHRNQGAWNFLDIWVGMVRGFFLTVGEKLKFCKRFSPWAAWKWISEHMRGGGCKVYVFWLSGCFKW